MKFEGIESMPIVEERHYRAILKEMICLLPDSAASGLNWIGEMF